MSGVLVRRLERRDLDTALELFRVLDGFQRGWRVFTPRRSVVDDARARYERALEDPNVVHLGAEVGGRLVGMAYGEVVVGSSISDERTLEVSNVVVLDEFRGRGVGRALVEAMFEVARERGVPWLSVKTYSENSRSLRFWESVGFRPRYVQMTASAARPSRDDQIDTSCRPPE